MLGVIHLKDIFIACVDGLKGFPEAIRAVYPKTRIQLCIVHQVRHSLRYVTDKDRRPVAADLKAIYAYIKSLGPKGVAAPAALSPGVAPDRPHIAFVPQMPARTKS